MIYAAGGEMSRSAGLINAAKAHKASGLYAF